MRNFGLKGSQAHRPEPADQIRVCELKTLTTVSELGSIRQASQLLGLRQSVVSRRVQKIENALGLSLFERSTTGVRLTVAGFNFVSQMATLGEKYKSAVGGARSAAIAISGELVVGSQVSFVSTPVRRLLKIFSENHSDVQLNFAENGRHHLTKMLSHRDIDLAFMVGQFPLHYDESLSFSQVPLILASHSRGRFARSKSLEWSDLGGTRFLFGFEEFGPDMHDLVVRRITAFGKTADIKSCEVSSTGLLGLVSIDLGATILCGAPTMLPINGVRFTPIAGECVPLSLVWRSENDNPALRRFISLARIEAKRNGVLSSASQNPGRSS